MLQLGLKPAFELHGAKRASLGVFEYNLPAYRRYQAVKEAPNKSTRADLHQKFLLAKKKITGILTDFKIFFRGPRKIFDFAGSGGTNETEGSLPARAGFTKCSLF